MTFNPDIPIDPCRAHVQGQQYPPECPQNPHQDYPNHLLSLDNGALHGSAMSHLSTAWAAATAVFTGAYFAYAYRHVLGRLLTSRALAPVMTKGVDDSS